MNLKNDKGLLGSKLTNIQERTSKPLGSKKEVEEKESITNEHTQRRDIRGNLESKMGLIRKRANNKFCELKFKNQ